MCGRSIGFFWVRVRMWDPSNAINNHLVIFFFLSGLPRYVPLASTFDKQRTKSCGRGGATEQDVSMFKMSCFPTRPPILTIVCRCLPVSCWSTSTLLANIGASRINISNISQYLTRIKWSQQSCLARIS